MVYKPTRHRTCNNDANPQTLLTLQRIVYTLPTTMTAVTNPPAATTQSDSHDIDTAADAALINEIQSQGVKRAADCLKVCDVMITGDGCPMRQACKTVGIDPGQFVRLTVRSQTLRQRYARAREAMLETKIDQLLDRDIDHLPRLDDGRIDPAAVQYERMLRDDCKWLISKVLPKMYGDKLELSGDQDSPLIIQQVQRVIVDSRSAQDTSDAIDVSDR